MAVRHHSTGQTFLTDKCFRVPWQSTQSNKRLVHRQPSKPPISEVPIASKEYVWQETFRFGHRQDCMLTRYVDNRLLIIPKEFFRQHQWQILCDLFFYDYPVELEPEPGMDFLGLRIDVTTGTVIYIQPDQQISTFSSQH